MVTNSFEDFAAEIVEEQLNKKQELEIFTDEFLRPFEEMRALETNEDGTVSLVIFFLKMIQNMAIRVLKFSNKGYKIRKVFA